MSNLAAGATDADRRGGIVSDAICVCGHFVKVHALRRSTGPCAVSDCSCSGEVPNEPTWTREPPTEPGERAIATDSRYYELLERLRPIGNPDASDGVERIIQLLVHANDCPCDRCTAWHQLREAIGGQAAELEALKTQQRFGNPFDPTGAKTGTEINGLREQLAERNQRIVELERERHLARLEKTT